MRKILCLLMFCSFFCVPGQQYDVKLTNKIYISYFNKNFKEPTVVAYNLYHAGGTCSRKNFKFLNDNPDIITATDKDYERTGYDKGHLAPAEDFAYDCLLDEMTFRYYNCVPQVVSLNRGVWLSYERVERKLSESDSIFVIIVNHYNGKFIGASVAVPNVCIKCLFSLTTHKCLLSVACSNINQSSSQRLPIATLDKNYGINIEQFVPFAIKI